MRCKQVGNKRFTDFFNCRQCSNNIGGDICVGAPTGSGKTLVYALPVLHSLKNRLLVRLRALVVLPTRDLALQVYAVFLPLCKAVGLHVGLAIGQTNFEEEQASLIGTNHQQCLSSNEVSGRRSDYLFITTHKSSNSNSSHYSSIFLFLIVLWTS